MSLVAAAAVAAAAAAGVGSVVLWCWFYLKSKFVHLFNKGNLITTCHAQL